MFTCMVAKKVRTSPRAHQYVGKDTSNTFIVLPFRQTFTKLADRLLEA